MESGNHKSITVVIAVIASLAVGMLGGWWIGAMSKESMTTTKDSAMQSSEQQDGTTVGGALMVRNKDIVDNAVNAKNVTMVVDLVQKAGLVDTLKSTGPFTVFAPSNDAFNAVPKATLDKVGGDMDLLKTVLTYHVVPGTYTSADLRAMAAKSESVKTVQGAMLSFKMKDNNVVIADKAGQEVMIETADVISSNGVTHVIKNVLLPVDPSTL